MTCKKCGQRMIFEDWKETAVDGLYKWTCKNCGNKNIAASRNVVNRIRNRHDFAMCLLLAFFIGVAAGYALRCAQLAGL